MSNKIGTESPKPLMDIGVYLEGMNNCIYRLETIQSIVAHLNRELFNGEIDNISESIKIIDTKQEKSVHLSVEDKLHKLSKRYSEYSISIENLLNNVLEYVDGKSELEKTNTENTLVTKESPLREHYSGIRVVNTSLYRSCDILTKINESLMGNTPLGEELREAIEPTSISSIMYDIIESSRGHITYLEDKLEAVTTFLLGNNHEVTEKM